MTWFKNVLKWAKIIWNLREEIEGILTLLQKHKIYLENDFEALKTLKEQLKEDENEQSTL